MNIEKIETNRLYLRPFTKDDALFQSVSGTIPKWENISAILLWKRLIRNM